MGEEGKLSLKTINARSTMSAADLRLLDQQIKYIMDQINTGAISSGEALTKAYSRIFKGGQFDWVKWLTLRDLLKRD